MARCTKILPDPTPLTLRDLKLGDTFAYRKRVRNTRTCLSDMPDRYMLTTAGVVCTRGGAAGMVTVNILDINDRYQVVEVFDVYRAGLRVLPKPAEATYALTLSQDEAQALRNVCGAVSQDAQKVTGSVLPIHLALVDAGLRRTDDKFNVLVIP